jgi:hypothetical protein
MNNFSLKLGFFVFTSLLVACGGGTSGTSDPDTALIRGVVISSEDGQSIANAEMYLINKDTPDSKQKSETDSEGRFLMIGSGSNFEIEILNTSNLPKLNLDKKFIGYSNIGMSILVNSKDETLASSSIESKFMINPACSKLFNNQGEELVQVASSNLENCNLEINSFYNNQINSAGTVSYFCIDELASIENSIILDATGSTSINLANLKSLGCDKIQIEVNSTDQSQFPSAMTLVLL